MFITGGAVILEKGLHSQDYEVLGRETEEGGERLLWLFDSLSFDFGTT